MTEFVIHPVSLCTHRSTASVASARCSLGPADAGIRRRNQPREGPTLRQTRSQGLGGEGSGSASHVEAPIQLTTSEALERLAQRAGLAQARQWQELRKPGNKSSACYCCRPRQDKLGSRGLRPFHAQQHAPFCRASRWRGRRQAQPHGHKGTRTSKDWPPCRHMARHDR